MATAATASATAQREYGVMVQPGITTVWPDLTAGIQQLFADRVASIPWVPASWLSQVQALQAAFPNDQVRLAPSKGANGGTLPNLPNWLLQDQARVDAWQDIYVKQMSIIQKFAANQQSSGKAELDRLIANAAYWNTGFGASLIDTATAIRDAPSNAINAIGNGILDVFGGILRKNWYLFAIAGVLALGWMFRKELLAKGASKVKAALA